MIVHLPEGEEEEEFISSGNWGGKCNSLSLKGQRVWRRLPLKVAARAEASAAAACMMGSSSVAMRCVRKWRWVSCAAPASTSHALVLLPCSIDRRRLLEYPVTCSLPRRYYRSCLARKG